MRQQRLLAHVLYTRRRVVVRLRYQLHLLCSWSSCVCYNYLRSCVLYICAKAVNRYPCLWPLPNVCLATPTTAPIPAADEKSNPCQNPPGKFHKRDSGHHGSSNSLGLGRVLFRRLRRTLVGKDCVRRQRGQYGVCSCRYPGCRRRSGKRTSESRWFHACVCCWLVPS